MIQMLVLGTALPRLLNKTRLGHTRMLRGQMECLVFCALTYFLIRIRVLTFQTRAFFKFHCYSIPTFTLLIDLAMRYVPLFKLVLVGRALTVVSVIAEERTREDSASTKWRCRCASWLNSKLLYPCSCWYKNLRSSRYHCEFLFSFYLYLFSHFYILFQFLESCVS